MCPDPEARRVLPLTRAATAAARVSLHSSLNVIYLGTEASDVQGSAIKARLVCPSLDSVASIRVVQSRLISRPLEVECAAIGQHLEVHEAASVAHFLTAHANIACDVETAGQQRTSHVVPVTVRLSCSRWVARALMSPATWTDASTVTVVSLSVAGRPLPTHCLPTMLLVGYNHAPGPAGAVLAAALAGDVTAVQAALDAGGSTEEVDAVRGEACGGECVTCKNMGVSSSSSVVTPFPLTLSKSLCTHI